MRWMLASAPVATPRRAERSMPPAPAKPGHCILSHGGFDRGAEASLKVPVAGLFLMSPPVLLHGAPPLDVAAVPVAIVHGWRDEWIPAARVVDWAATRRADLMLVDDTHRLPGNVRTCGTSFQAFLRALPRHAD